MALPPPTALVAAAGTAVLALAGVELRKSASARLTRPLPG